LTSNPKAAEIAEGKYGNQGPDRQAYPTVAEGEVRGVVARGVIDQDRYDSNKRRGKKACESTRKAHEQGSEPAQIADGNAKQET